ncbi:MAG: hypothetical protein ACOC44_01365 [Promethearchaeia archaeon]
MGIGIELFNLLKKKGFRDTINVLTKFKDFSAEKHQFYNELNKFSYYNSFFRIKDELLDNKLIKIVNKDNKKIIILTEKGLNVYNKLLELSKIISA